MILQGHERLRVAILAALAVHALVFFIGASPSKVKLSAASGAMQVSFIAPSVVPEADEAVMVPQVVKKTVKHVDQPILKQQSSPQAVAVISSSTPSDVQVLPSEAHKKSPQVAETIVKPEVSEKSAIAATVVRKNAPVEPVHSHNDVARNADMGAVPQNVQQQLLVNVTYPKMARRHGWQGRAEFELRIYKQSVDTLTLLASTGFPILDHAAERGLALARDVPLSNGLYHMPVVFDLR